MIALWRRWAFRVLVIGGLYLFGGIECDLRGGYNSATQGKISVPSYVVQ